MASQILEWALVFVQQVVTYAIVSWLLSNIVIALNKAYLSYALCVSVGSYEYDEEHEDEFVKNIIDTSRAECGWLITVFSERFISSLLKTITSIHLALMAIEGSVLTALGYWVIKLSALAIPVKYQIPWTVLGVAFWIMLITRVLGAHANDNSSYLMNKTARESELSKRFMDSVENPNSEYDEETEFRNFITVILNSSEVALQRSIACSTILVMILIVSVIR